MRPSLEHLHFTNCGGCREYKGGIVSAVQKSGEKDPVSSSFITHCYDNDDELRVKGRLFLSRVTTWRKF